MTYSRSVYYNAKNQITLDESSTIRSRYGSSGTDTWKTVVRNDYDADGTLATAAGYSYALGNVVWMHEQTYKNGSTDAIDDHMTRYNYAWYDGAVQSSIAYDKHYGYDNNNGSSGTFDLSNFDTNFTTYYNHNALGHLTSAYVNDGVPKTLTYTNDASGQIVRRTESRNSNPSGPAPRELYYRFGGKQMGMVGNDGTSDTSYVQSVADRSAASPDITSSNAGLFRNGTSSGASSYADFSQSTEAYNSSSRGSAGGTYTVRAGDTLAAIAAALYGDANLWYKLAEANGLTASSGLIEGSSLILPAGVTKSAHNAQTFMPYDPASAMGDTQPTTPKPTRKGGNCGTFGAILLVVIAVAVTIATHGAAAGFAGSLGLSTGAGGITAATATVAGGTIAAGSAAGIAGGVAAAIAGSVASQAFGLATGIQSKFSFKQVALAGLSAGVSGGLSSLAGAGGPLGRVGSFLGKSNFVSGAARGALSSVITQGVATATGLQKKFSWAGVAVGGVVGGVSGAINGRFAGTAAPDSIEDYAQQTLTGGAAALAGATARSLIDGSDFGDNILAALPDVVGSTVGNIVARGVASQPQGDPTSLLPNNFWDDPVPFSDKIYAVTSRTPAQQEIEFNLHYKLGEFADGYSATGPHNPRLVGHQRNGGLVDTIASWADVDGDGSFNLWQDGTAGINQLFDSGQRMIGNIENIYDEIVVTGSAYIKNKLRANFSRADTDRIPRSIMSQRQTEGNAGSASGMGYGRGAADFATANSVMSAMRTLDRALSAPWHKPVTATQPPMSIFDYPSKNPPTYKWALNGKGVIAAGLEVGGLRGATKVGSTLANSTEQLIPRVNVSEKFTVKTKGGGITYAYRDPNRGHGLDMYVDSAGILGLDIRASSAYRESGTDMLLSGMQRLKADGVDVKGIRGQWLAGTDSVNYAQYTKNLEIMNVREAALNTWTGKLASNLGYTEVIVGNPHGRDVTAVFYRKSK